MEEALEGISVKNFINDLITEGKNVVDHNENLRILLKRLTNLRLKINPKKVKIGMRKVTYLAIL